MKEFFIENGYFKLKNISKSLCEESLNIIKANRNFDSNLFLDENEFNKQTVRWGTNPKPGRNLTEKLDVNLIINEIQNELIEVLGNDFQVMFPKVICGVPDSWLPEYVKKEIYNNAIPNLGAFIKPEYRDITYFHGIDYHQDIIDYKNRVTDFITLYVYLDNVTENDAPLYILPKTHVQGCHTFPHDLKTKDNKRYIYNGTQITNELVLTGDVGTCYFWHSCLLHGTQPTKSSKERISLRFLISKKRSLIDLCNDAIEGDLKLNVTRLDVDENHVPIIKGNILKNKNN
jgi:ectoine hydroxylase-related dioxygenase (phytanoyl-CoA dioxygenase family)